MEVVLCISDLSRRVVASLNVQEVKTFVVFPRVRDELVLLYVARNEVV